MTEGGLGPRFCLRPGYLDAIPKIVIEVAARETAHGTEVEFKLPWVNFPNFKPRLNEVIALDAELCYSDGGLRIYRTFTYGNPLGVSQPAALGKVQLVNRLEPSPGHWKADARGSALDAENQGPRLQADRHAGQSRRPGGTSGLPHS